MRVRILAGLACCATLLASGQSTPSLASIRPLSLQECLELALSRNLDLRIEHLIADTAGYNLAGAYGAYSPIFLFSAQRGFVSEPANFDAEKFNPDYPAEIHTDNIGPGLKGQLPLGMSYDLSATAMAEDARTDFRSDPDHAGDFPGGI